MSHFNRIAALLSLGVLCLSAAYAAQVVVTPGTVAGYLYYPPGGAGIGGAGGTGSTSQFLKIVISGTNSQIAVSAPPGLPITNSGMAYNSVPPDTYKNNPLKQDVLSTDLKMTVSLLAGDPPANAPVHLIGTKQSANTNVGGVIYIAGMPNKVNFKPVDGRPPITVTVGGGDVVLAPIASGNKLILPTILLPDLALISDASPANLSSLPMPGSYGYSYWDTASASMVAVGLQGQPFPDATYMFPTTCGYFNGTCPNAPGDYNYVYPFPMLGTYSVPSTSKIGVSSQGDRNTYLGRVPMNAQDIYGPQGLILKSEPLGGLSYILYGAPIFSYGYGTFSSYLISITPSIVSQGKIAYLLTY